MSNERFSWVFDLQDRMGNPAGAMASKLEALEKALGANASATDRATEAMDKFAGASKHASGAHEGFLAKLHDGVELAKWFGEALHKMWEKGKELGGEILSGMAFKQSSLIALEAMAGTRKEAIEIFEGVEDFAWKTGQSVQTIMGQTKDLMSAGFKPGQISVLREMLADLKVAGKEGAADTVAQVLGNMGRVGHLTSRHILALNSAGISAKLVFANLSEATGLSEAALKKYIQAGVIPADKALLSLVRAEQQTYKIDAVGGLAARMQRTVPALVEKVKGIPERLFSALVGVEGGGEDSPFAHILGNIADAFDPSGPMGEHVIARIRGLIDRIGEAFGISGGPGGLFAELAGPNGAQKVLEIFDSIADAIERTIPKIRQAVEAIGDIATFIGKIAEAVKYLGPKGGLAESIGSREMTPEEATAARITDQIDTERFNSDKAHRIAADPKLQSPGNMVWLSEYKRSHPNGAFFAQPSNSTTVHAPVSVVIQGNATKEDVQAGVAAGMTDALEKMGMQTGH